MKKFIVGDVHGYFNELKMILSHWNPQEEILIQVGDLIDRGKDSLKCIDYMMSLQKKFPEKVVVLLGNHEHMMLDYHYKRKYDNALSYENTWLCNGGVMTLNNYRDKHNKLLKHLVWMAALPTTWEDDDVIVSHAGVVNRGNPANLFSDRSVLWNRGPTTRLEKLQIFGHTIVEEPCYCKTFNSLHIDTGICAGNKLTGVKISNKEDWKFICVKSKLSKTAKEVNDVFLKNLELFYKTAKNTLNESTT